uniref:Uncharacterized protein n=1 Tax=viral metagenome TaxID=1070528 RepID=A0A6C0JEU5_9ZZZZ
MNNKNEHFIDNKEIFNQRLFDRNQFSAELASVQNRNPQYFSENYKENKSNSERIFENRFDTSIYNFHQKPKACTVDFSKSENSEGLVNFKSNYGDYINSDKN